MRREYGHPGHFIGSPWCLFHLHTHVGDYRAPSERKGEQFGPRREIGVGRTFETFVFEWYAYRGEEGDQGPDIESRGYAELVAKYEAMR